MENLRSRTLKGLHWSVASQIGRQSLKFIVFVILARILSPREFGLVAMIVVFTGFAQVFSSLGLGAALIQKTDIEPRHLNTVFWMNVLTGLGLTGIVAGIAPLVARFYDEPILCPLMMVIALNFFIGSLNVVQDTLLHKKMDFRRLAIIEIVASILAGVIAIAMALFGYGVWALVAQSLVLTSVSVCMMWSVSTWRPTLSFEKSALEELLGFSLNLLGFDVFNFWTRNFDNLLIGKFIGSSALGVYSKAYDLMLLPITQISAVVSRVMFPALCEIQKDITRVKMIYLRAHRMIAVVTFPMMVGLMVVAEPFVLVLYGEKWRGVIPILQIFCLTGMLQSVGTTVGWIYKSQGRADIQLKWGLFSGTVVITAFTIGLQWGVVGVAVAYVLTGYVLLWYPSWTLSGRLIDLRFSEMLRNLAGPFFCAAGMGILTWGVALTLPQSWPHWAFLSVQIPFGILVYFLFVNLFKIRAVIEFRELLRNRG